MHWKIGNLGPLLWAKRSLIYQLQAFGQELVLQPKEMQNLLSQRVVCKRHRSNFIYIYILSIRYFPVPVHSNAHSFSAEDWSAFQAPLQTPLRISSPQNRGLHTTPNRKRRTSKMSSAVTESDRFCFVRPLYPNTLLMLWHISQKRFDMVILAGIPELLQREVLGGSLEVKTENFDHQKTSYSNVHVHVMRFISKPHICLTVSHRWSGFNMDSECVGQTLWAGSLFWNIYAWLDGVRWKPPAFLQLKYVFIWRWRHQHPPFQICKLRGMKENSNTTLLSPYQNWRSRRSKHTHQPKKNSHTWSK